MFADPTAPEQVLIPSSPRSVEACFRLGIDPVDLQYHPPAWYKRKEDADDEVSQLRYERNEAVRQVCVTPSNTQSPAAHNQPAASITSSSKQPY